MFLVEMNNVNQNYSISKPSMTFRKIIQVDNLERSLKLSKFREVMQLVEEKNELVVQGFVTNVFRNGEKIRIDNCIICNLNYSNLKIHITDSEGNMEYSVNSGLLRFKGSQKTSRQAILAILNKLISRKHYYSGKNISIHIKGFVRKYNKLIINKIKSNFIVKLIRYYNLHPHNGCRPRKIRRLKTRTRR